MSEFDVNIIDKNYYKLPLFPISDNDNDTLSLFERFFKLVTKINWHNIYDNERVQSELFIDNELNKEMLRFANGELQNLKSIDKQVEMILASENDRSPKRAREVKAWLMRYFEHENEINFPKFNSIVTIRLAYLILISVLIKVFPEGIWCNSKQIERLIKEKRLKLFLPSHKSHLDYMIVHIMCIRFAQPVPAVVAGENLNVKFFGNVLAKVGAVYIKRNWFNYTDILMDNYSNFFKFVVNRGIGIELFIEGGRSRDGKLLYPKFGILSLILNIVKSEKAPVAVYPMSIQYEKLYEFESINKEMIGLPKHKESTMNILRHGYSDLFHPRNCGKAFFQFADPIDLQSYDKNVTELGLDVMDRINGISYITTIALFNTAIYLLHYRGNGRGAKRHHPRIPINEIVKEVRHINDEILKYGNSQANLHELQNLDDLELTKLLIQQCEKFNPQCRIDKGWLIVGNVTNLIIYKNNLIHLFINKSLIAKVLLNCEADEVNHNLSRLLKIFESQFISFNRFNLTKELEQLGLSQLNSDTVSEHCEQLQWLSQFLDPFIDAYVINGELLLRDKDNNLANLQKLQPNFIESRNKLYLVNFLKLVHDLKIYSKRQEKVNHYELEKLIEYLSRFMTKSDVRSKL